MPRHSPQKLLNGGKCKVPKDVAVCPECGGRLYAESCEWESETGKPSIGGLYVSCEHESFKRDDGHRHWQIDWMPTQFIVENWAGVRLKFSLTARNAVARRMMIGRLGIPGRRATSHHRLWWKWIGRWVTSP